MPAGSLPRGEFQLFGLGLDEVRHLPDSKAHAFDCISTSFAISSIMLLGADERNQAPKIELCILR